MRFATLTAFIGASLLASTSFALTIDFNAQPGIGNPTPTSVSESGFILSSLHMHVVGEPTMTSFGGVVSNGTVYLTEEAGGLGQPITLARIDGGAFTLQGFDGAESFLDDDDAANGGFPNASQINLLINPVIGAPFGASFSLDGIKDGAGGADDFQTFLTAFANIPLSSVVFSGALVTGAPGAFSIDNIVVDAAAVPEPATASLALLGLAGLVLRRRRNA